MGRPLIHPNSRGMSGIATGGTWSARIYLMNANTILSSVALRFGVALVSFGCFGCANTMQFGTPPREAMAKRVDDTAAQVAEVKGRMDVAERALNDIANHPSPDLKRQFNSFSDALDKFEAESNKLRAEVEQMEAGGREYLVTWDREIATIQDEDLRNRTAERRQDVAGRIDALHERYIAAREAIAPVVHRFQEIETALKVDLTAAGVDTVRASVRNTDDLDGARRALNELGEAFREASISLAAAASPLDRDNR